MSQTYADLPIKTIPFKQTNHTQETPGRGRMNCLRLMLPGHYDESVRRRTPVSLTPAVEEVLESNTGIDFLELLSYPGESQQEHLINAATSTGNASRAIRQLMAGAKTKLEETTLDQFLDEPVSDETDNVPDNRIGAIKNAFDKHLPKNVGTQICDLDLTPVGEIPVPTSRLVIPPGRSLTLLENYGTTVMLDLMETLTVAGIPYLAQVLLSTAPSNKPHDYLLGVRLAVFDDEYGIGTPEDLLRHVEEPYEYDIAQFVDGAATSNFGLPLEQYRKLRQAVEANPYRPPRPEQYSVHPGTVEDLATGFLEYGDLLRGVFDADDRYKSIFGGYARIPVKKRDLDQFCLLYPAYFEYCPWGRCSWADQPRTITESVDRPAPGTRQTLGIERANTTTQETAGTNTESDPHVELLNFTVEFLIRQGYTIVAVDQETLDINVDIEGPDPTTIDHFEGESQPDIVAKKDGQLHIFEIEVENESKQAALLTNLARADYHDIPVTVVAPEFGKARNKCEPILEPFKEREPDRTLLYNWTTVAKTEDVGYLLPRDIDESKWWLTPEGRLQLDSNGTVLAAGNANDPVSTYEYSTPRYRKQGREYIVESATGEEIERYPAKKAMLTAWTQIRVPHVPTRQSYIANTTIQFQESNRLKLYDPDPTWDKAKASLRYEDAATAFFEAHTVAQEDEIIPMPDARAVFNLWYTAQTDRNKPNETWFGRTVPFETGETNKRKYVVDRTWRYPSNLQSPDLPFIDADDKQTG